MGETVDRDKAQRAGIVRTGLILASVALTFFLGVIIKYYVLR